MKQTVILMIETGQDESLLVDAYDTNTATIFIKAGSMEAAEALLPIGKKQATEAMERWTPDKMTPATDPEQQKHYYVINRSIEEMDDFIKEYETTTSGKRFIKTVENAKKFFFSHVTGHGGITCSQLEYLANLHRNSFLNGSFDLLTIGYRRGWKEGQAELKTGRKGA